MGKKQAKENLSSMEMFTKEILSMVNSTEKEITHLLDQEKFMKGILWRIIFRDKVKQYGLTAQIMKVDF